MLSPEEIEQRVEAIKSKRRERKLALQRLANKRWADRNRDYLSERDARRYYRDLENNRAKARNRRRGYAATGKTTGMWRKWRYGITPEEFNKLFEAQGKRCAICGTDAPGARAWHLDHCHDTATIRGVLCRTCNLGIGHLKHDPALLLAAIEYLKRQDSCVVQDGVGHSKP